MAYPCPVCGFEVFDEPAGSYDICPVCDWEDDEVQLRFPAMSGGANTQSLYECQQELLTRLPVDVTNHLGYVRCADWRPVIAADLENLERAPAAVLRLFGRS